MIQVGNVHVRSFDIATLDVYWDVTSGYDTVVDYDMFVLRSEAQFGPYNVQAGPFRMKDRFRDTSVPGYHAFYTRVFYKIRLTHRVTGETKDFPEEAGVRLEAMPDLEALEIARMERLKLEQHKGRLLWIFPRRHSGQRCSVCVDPVMNQRLRSSCMSCFDTGWVGGYHSPVEVYGQIPSVPQTIENLPQGKVASQDSVLMLANYPILSEGDVVVEAENIRWRVGATINAIEKQRALIRQQAPIHRLAVTDVEYALPILLSDDEVRNLQATPARNYTNPQTLGQPSLDALYIGLFGASR